MLKKIVIAAVAVAALGSNGVMAGTVVTGQGVAGSMNVNANVANSCTIVGAGSMVFKTPGSNNLTSIPATGVGITASSTITYTCDGDTDFAIGLGQGNQGNRTMTSGGGGSLPYDLSFVAAGGTSAVDVNFATTINAGAAPAAIGGIYSGIAPSVLPGNNPVDQTLTVFGVIPAGTAKPALGGYSDSVAVNIVF